MRPLAIPSWPMAVAVAALRRHGWPVWMPCTLMFLGFPVFEPSRDIFSHAQVNRSPLVLPVLAHGFRAEADRSGELRLGWRSPGRRWRR